MGGTVEMLKLNYIIIGTLPEKQEKYLEENLKEEQAQSKGIHVIALGEGKESAERLRLFLAKESLLISGEEKELAAAGRLGMAALGYLPEEGQKTSEETRDIAQGTGMEMSKSSCASPGIHKEAEGAADGGKADMYAEGFEEIGLTFLRHVYERHHHIPWTILETKRCVVREFSMEYLDELFALYEGEGMTDYIEPLYPYEEEKAYQEAYIEYMYGFYGYGMWLVCDKKTGKLIGRAGVEHREELGGAMELGYAIGVPYQRQGYAMEVCRAILDYARDELQMTEINCLIEEGNTVSERFAEKLGFSLRNSLVLDGKNMKRYVLCRI